MRTKIIASACLVLGTIGVAVGIYYARQSTRTEDALAMVRRLQQRKSPADYVVDSEDGAVVARIAPWGKRYHFPTIDEPRYQTIAQAEPNMSDEEVVLGLAVAGQFRAYPINLLNYYEMVREELGGLPLLVTW